MFYGASEMKYLPPVIAHAVVIAAIATLAWCVLDRNAGALPDGSTTGNARLEADQTDLATKTPGRVAEA